MRNVLLAPALVLGVVACGEAVAPTAGPRDDLTLMRPDFSFITTWGATTAYETELRVCGYALGGVTATNTGVATVANQLTLNLIGASLPNPSQGNLTLNCTLVPGTPALGLTLQTALNILNGVGGPHTTGYILSVKSALDAFANIG